MPLEQTFPADKGLHDLKSFDCGKPSMNEFLSRFSVKHSKLGQSMTYVLTETAKALKRPIAAYYSKIISRKIRRRKFI